MSAVAGILLLCASIVGAALSALLFRNPHRPRWARAGSLADLAALVLVALFAFGTASFASFAFSLPQPTGWFMASAGVAGAFLFAWALWRGLRVRRRLAEFDLEVERLSRASRGDDPPVVRSVPRPGRPDLEPPLRPTGAGGAARKKKAA